MKRLKFTLNINATAEKVWFALWDEPHYRQWVSVFTEGSYAVSDWKEGSKIHFISPSGEGMYSEITVNKPFEKMYFTHKGEVKNFEEQPLNETSSAWSGSQENYTLTETNGVTTLEVLIDMSEEYVDYFKETLPKGLLKVKANAENLSILIETSIHASIEKVWEYWTNPTHIMNWNNASPDWHTPKATNDLRVGGRFSSTMAAKDGSVSFDFYGDYTDIVKNELIAYTLGDERKVKIQFKADGDKTTIIEQFEPETENTLELQKAGWQSILNNFKRYTEEN